MRLPGGSHAGMRLILGLCVLMTLLSGAWAQSSDSARPPQVYVIGVGDLIGVHVWKDEELTRREITVRPDGKISLQLVGEIQAAGLTPGALAKNIRAKLREYMTDPFVAVFMEEVNSYRIYVLGHVKKSGVYTFNSPVRLVEAIATAGGFDQFADTSRLVVLTVEPGGGQKRVEVDYKKIVSGSRLEDNLELSPGDTVIVP